MWIGWDRVLLDQWGLRAVMDRVPMLAWVTELSYLCLYLIPPACLATLHFKRAWNRTDRFLLVFAAGTFLTYTLLPVIPVESPRLAFSGQDLPAVTSVWREANVWILDHLDISTSVFPSGHVAVAFSSSFGMRQAMPGHLTLFLFLLCLACCVYLATVYGRYHYAVDGVASLLICLVTWGICALVQPEA
jgi:membrane-associated phospholipid phosphatase